MKENVLVSACLLGEKCRYDGKSKEYSEISCLKEKYNLIPVCPEVLGGLETPRTPCEIQNGRVISKDGQDKTAEYEKGAKTALEIALKNNCKTAVLKAKSPSCGKGKIYDGSFSKVLTDGNGVTADLLIKNNITVLTEKEKKL